MTKQTAKPGAREPMVRALLLLTLPFALGACADTQPAGSENDPVSESALPPEPDTGPYPIGDPYTGIEAESCNALQAEEFVGREADEQTRAELTEAVDPVTEIRWVEPGGAPDEELNLERLNVVVDTIGEILSVHCG